MLQLVFTYVPVMNTLFGITQLDAAARARCVAVGAAIFALVAAEKAIRRSRLSGGEINAAVMGGWRHG